VYDNAVKIGASLSQTQPLLAAAVARAPGQPFVGAGAAPAANEATADNLARLAAVPARLRQSVLRLAAAPGAEAPAEDTRSVTGLVPPTNLPQELRVKSAPHVAAGSLPQRFDWRTPANRRIVTSIKQQGSCGCCWAFATVGVVEANWARTRTVGGHADWRNMSEQHVLDCSGGGTCAGGWWAFDFFKLPSGALGESEMPYQERYNGCHTATGGPFQIADWHYVSTQGGTSGIPTDDSLKRALMDFGPLAIAIDATPSFMKYKGGGYFAENPSPYLDGSGQPSVNHAITLIGWDENGWRIKNSWGEDWGEDGGVGYIRYRNNNLGYGAAYVVPSGGGVQATGPSVGAGGTGAEGKAQERPYEATKKADQEPAAEGKAQEKPYEATKKADQATKGSERKEDH
jgi:hypothetical protein